MEELIRDDVDSMFREADVDPPDNRISIEEFVNWGNQNPMVRSQLGMLDGLQLDQFHKLRIRRGVFGVPLNDIVAQARRNLMNPNVPWFVVEIAELLKQHGLEVEGIFRESSSPDLLEEYRKAINDGVSLTAKEGFNDCDVHALACLFKAFLRELPDSLITDLLTQQFISLAMRAEYEKEEIVEPIVLLYQQLPSANKHLLKFVIHLLLLVNEKEEDNLMTRYNLAIVFAPTIVQPRNVLLGLNYYKAFYQIPLVMMNNFERIFLE